MIEFGAIYTEKNKEISKYLPRYNDGLNDQKTHFWFPVRIKTTKEDNVYTTEDSIYMIDTYQFDMPYECQNDYNKMVDFLKSLGKPENNSWLKHRTSNYYYTACVKITEESINAFEKVANLDEYIIVDDDEFRYYDDKDIIRRVMFWEYQRSGAGVRLKRKNAVINIDLKLNALFYDFQDSIKRPSYSIYSFEKLLSCEKGALLNNLKYDVNKVKYIQEVKEYLDKIGTEYNEHINQLKEKYLKEK